ncbi:unnamed protein product, partial [Ilex paraguariensis]
MASSHTMNNLTTDESALLAFKAHITSDPYNILATNWSTSTTICNWTGVSCSVRHRRVTALNLSDMGLQGTIAPHLGNLSFLASLDISFNSFHGFLPQELAHLGRLKEVDLSFNEFTGQIPSWFGTFTDLQHMRLYNNSFQCFGRSSALASTSMVELIA